MELSYSVVNPQQFVKELKLDKNDFVARMSRLKESEKQKRLAKENEQKLRRHAELARHSEEAMSSWENTKDQLKAREISREQARLEYESYLKQRKIPGFQVIQDRYDEMKKKRGEESSRMLQTIHEKFAPGINNDKMREHVRTYNGHLVIQDFKRKRATESFLKNLKEHEKSMGIVFNQPKSYAFGRTQSENEKHFAEKKKRDAAIEYGRIIKSDMFPKIENLTPSRPLPIDLVEGKATHSRQKLFG